MIAAQQYFIEFGSDMNSERPVDHWHTLILQVFKKIYYTALHCTALHCAVILRDNISSKVGLMAPPVSAHLIY